MDDDYIQRTLDAAGRPVGEGVERYGRRPSTARYRCEVCKSTNIDDFHVDGVGHGTDAKGYKIKGIHDQEGWPCGGRCWPWTPQGAEAKEPPKFVAPIEVAVEGLGKIGGALQQGFDKIFKRP